MELKYIQIQQYGFFFFSLVISFEFILKWKQLI